MRMPFLKNFRRGFATNSSSSHSFVYLKNEHGLGAETPSRHISGEFGWEDFRLDTIREKLFYVLVGMIGGGWRSDVDAAAEFADRAAQFPELTEEDFESAAAGYIDHDSVGTISLEDARDPYLVVFGGNDNDDVPSQERADAIRAGEVDWSKTAMDYHDLQYIRVDDEEGQRAALAYLKENPWAARW